MVKNVLKYVELSNSKFFTPFIRVASIKDYLQMEQNFQLSFHWILDKTKEFDNITENNELQKEKLKIAY